jgi:mannose-6-phosphate isomerase-like protein (cupin superfamily)
MKFVAGGPRRPGAAPWRVLAGPEMTGGGVGFGDARMPPHTAGPGLHVHSYEDEAQYVVAGTMTFKIGDDLFEAGPETLVWLPRGIPHTFANRGGEPAWVVGITSPAGIEAMFEEQAAYFAGLSGPPDNDYLSSLGARFGVTSVGPPLEV